MTHFRLYVVGDAPNSRLATTNLAAFCERHLAGKHKIEIVDVLHEPARALLDGVLLTPMLSILSQQRVHRLIGNLSDSSRIMDALGLEEGSE